MTDEWALVFDSAVISIKILIKSKQTATINTLTDRLMFTDCAVLTLHDTVVDATPVYSNSAVNTSLNIKSHVHIDEIKADVQIMAKCLAVIRLKMHVQCK